jgi:hypothetical protein
MHNINGTGKATRKLLFLFSTLVLVTCIGGYLIRHMITRRTPLPHHPQQQKIVLRCSEGIQKRSATGDWAPLLPGERLEDGSRIAAPQSGRSFLSFDAIRLMSDNNWEIEIAGFRSFSLTEGSVALATARQDKPAEITLGTCSMTTNGSVSRISTSHESASIECISGEVTLNPKQDAELDLVAGQKATIEQESLTVTAANLSDPFRAQRVPVMERIRKRFEHVIAEYSPRRQGPHEAWRQNSPRAWFAAEYSQSLQFASYIEESVLEMAEAVSDDSIQEYYESLFVPSNRSIFMGKEKVVPITPYYAASFPTWSHDASMIAFIEASTLSWQARVRVARVDNLDNPWDISQEYEAVLPFFPITWAPDNRHVLFMVADHMDFGRPDWQWWWSGPYHIKIAPVNPDDGVIRDFASPLPDSVMDLPLPVGKTISPVVVKLPWNDALLCVSWGNLAYVPIADDGQAVAGAPGLFLTDFNPREFFVMGGYWSPSGNMIFFTAAEDLDFDHLNGYILYDVEDIIDGFTRPPRSSDDYRLKQVAPSPNPQLPGNFSFDESLVFFQEDVNGSWQAVNPVNMFYSDFDLFYADARPDEPSRFTQIHLPGNQMFLRLSPEGNRLMYAEYRGKEYDLKVVSFDIVADMDTDLGGVLIDNSGTNLIVPPGTLEENFKVKISTPFSITEEADVPIGERHLFAMRLLDAQGLESPKFVEPMTLTIRYTQEEVAGLDEGMLEIYYYDESDAAHPAWVPLGATVDPEHNEITVEIQHFSKFSVGVKDRQ